MSHFKWGVKGEVGVVEEEVQYYESFTYKGVEYMLHDCVYANKGDEHKIGKIVEIWEEEDKSKGVKIHWFFHPCEFAKFGCEKLLENQVVLEKEIFLASGDGAGVATDDTLEAVRGKCNVICISRDERNPQPLKEEVQMAGFIFYRTFDIEKLTFAEIVDDKVGGLEVKFVFNRKQGEQVEDEAGIGADVRSSILIRKSSPGGCPTSVAASDANIVSKTSDFEKKMRRKLRIGNYVNKEKVAEPARFAKQRLPEKRRVRKLILNTDEDDEEDAAAFLQHFKEKIESKADFMGNKDSAEKIKNIEGENIVVPGKRDDVVSKKARLRKLILNPEDDDEFGDITATLTSSKEKIKSKAGFMQKNDGKKRNQSEDKLLKVSYEGSAKEGRKTEGLNFEVSRKPADERRKWFRPLPWDERMKKAYEQGTLVLLSNLDPECSSGEVVDIIWHACNEMCTAKMVQCTAISSPHYGQAFIILRRKEASERIIKYLNDGCLMLNNERPLLVSLPRSPNVSQKQSQFVGHLSLDKAKRQMSREQNEAVSTSHYSQPNTVEFEMSMEWRLLQERSDGWWKRLHKQQGKELEKLKDDLKKK